MSFVPITILNLFILNLVHACSLLQFDAHFKLHSIFITNLKSLCRVFIEYFLFLFRACFTFQLALITFSLAIHLKISKSQFTSCLERGELLL